MDEDRRLREQVAYYRARAGEYHHIYSDTAQEDALLRGLPISGDVLELACGTGRWTPLLEQLGTSVTALDSSPEMLELAAARVARVEFVEADVFAWRPTLRWDTVFFAFFLSHVPRGRLAEFLETVRASLRSGGTAVFVDVDTRERDAEDVVDGDEETVRRTLRDGRTFEIVKVFWTPAELMAALAEHGWVSRVSSVGDRFLAGWAVPAAPPLLMADA